jgi:UDP-N-acetylmuramoyl-tripeptide--D-alanyl-D-alanine ligase
VAETKGAIYDALPADGIAVINADDAFAPYFAQRRRTAGCCASGWKAAPTCARDIRLAERTAASCWCAPLGEIAVELPLGRAPQRANALAAAALALAAMHRCRPSPTDWLPPQPVAGPPGRASLRNGAVLIDDSYNANPGSLRAAHRHA